MKIRYLYGKEEFLSPMISGDGGIRISDLTHYSRMENENMRDDEMNKIFYLNRDNYGIEINGIKINSRDLSRDVVISITPRHCYCICLSKKCDDPELYKEFKADICIAFDVDELQERMKLIDKKFKEILVVGRDITYYKNGVHPSTLDRMDLVFFKPEIFSHEAEYRIALFYPLNKTGFKHSKGTIPFYKEDESTHIFLSHSKKDFITSCIVDIFKRKKDDE